MHKQHNVRLYQFTVPTLESNGVYAGGDTLTDFLVDPIIKEDESGYYELSFRYALGGQYAEYLQYYRVIVSRAFATIGQFEEPFYIHQLEKDLEGVTVTAKHYTHMIDRVPVNRISQKARTLPQAVELISKNAKADLKGITLTGEIGVGGAQDLLIEEGATIGQITTMLMEVYGCKVTRIGKSIRFGKRGTNLDYELAKYKNIQERDFVGDADDVVTRANITATVERDWILPKPKGTRLAPNPVRQDDFIGRFTVELWDYKSNLLVHDTAKFSVYDDNGHRVATFETGSEETTKKRTEQLAKYKSDLAYKKERLAEYKNKKQTEFTQEQIQKLNKAIPELESKINYYEIGQPGVRVLYRFAPGTYHVFLEGAPDGYWADYWGKTIEVTGDMKYLKFFLRSKDEEGFSDKLLLKGTYDSPLIDDYPIVLDGFYNISQENITTQADLNKYGNSFFERTNADLLMEDFTITPNEMANREYDINIGDSVIVYFEDKNESRRVNLSAYEYKPMTDEVISYTFGKKKVGIGGVLGAALRQWLGDAKRDAEAIAKAHANAVSSEAKTMFGIANGNIDGLSDHMNLVVESIVADTASFNQLYAGYAEIDELVANKASITELEAQIARIQFLETSTVRTEELYANYLSAERIRAEFATLEHLESDYAKITTLNAEVGVLNELYAKTAKIVDLQAVYGRIDEVEAKIISTENLEAINAKILELESSIITADSIASTYATIESLNVEIARVNNLLADKASITDLTAINANIETLLAWDGRIMTLESASADVAELLAGNLTAENMQAGLIKAGSALIEDGAITNAKIDTASVNRIMIDEANIKTTAILDAFIRNLSAEVITTGTLKAGVIGAGTITVDKLESNIGEKLGIVSSKEINIAIQESINDTVNDNLIEDSEDEYTSNEILQYGVGAVLEADKTYTVSFDLKTSVPQTTLIYSLEGYDIGNHYVESTTEYQRHYFTFDTNTLLNENNTTFIFNAIPTSGVDVFVRKVRIKEGTSPFLFVERDKIISSINLSKEGVTISGEKVTINGDTHIENATIKSAHIDDGAITNAKIDNAGIDLAKIEHGELFMMTVENGFISKGTAGELVIDGAQIKEASITSAQIVSLDASIINAGTLSVERLEIRGSDKSIVYAINNITGKTQATSVDTINGEVLTPRTITADRIVAQSITSNEIKANSITSNEMLTGTITAESGILANLAVTTAKIADLAITTAKIADANITNAKIAKLAVGTANIQDLAVTDAKIANITADKITASWIESGKIKTGSLTTSVISADSWKSLDLSSNTSISLAITDIVETTLPEEVQKQIEENVGEQLPVNIDNLLTEAVDEMGDVFTVFEDNSFHKYLRVGEWYTLSFNLELRTEESGAVLLYSTTGYDIGNHYANVTNYGGRFYFHFQPQTGTGITNLVVNGLSAGGFLSIHSVMLTKGKNLPSTYADYVRQNKVLASINLSDETVRIEGKRIEITGDTYIQNGVINNAHISTAGIDFAKIKNVQITSAMISDLTATVTNITTAQIKSATIDWAQIQGAKITNAMIDDGTISTAKIANLEVDVGMIADASIENAIIDWAQIRNVRVTNAQIVDLDAGKIKTGILTSKVGGNSINLNTGAFTFTNTTFKGTGTTGSQITIKDGILQTYSDGNYIKIGNGEILIYPTNGEFDSGARTKLNAKSGIIRGFTGHYLDFSLPSNNITGYSKGYVTRVDTNGSTNVLRFVERKAQVVTCVVETVGVTSSPVDANYPSTRWVPLSLRNTDGMAVDMRNIKAIHIQALNEDVVAGYDYNGTNIEGSSGKVDEIRIWYRYIGRLTMTSQKLAFSITLIL